MNANTMLSMKQIKRNFIQSKHRLIKYYKFKLKKANKIAKKYTESRN